MKLGIFSDTHNYHQSWYDNLDSDVKKEFDSADALIFTGDCTNVGSAHDVHNFLEWFNHRPNPYKIMIAGNHDFFFDTDEIPKNKRHIPVDVSVVAAVLCQYPKVTYLCNADIKISKSTDGGESESVRIWGSPMSKWFHDWGFNRHPGEDIKRYWDMIPKDTDVIMTHGPVYGIADVCPQGNKLINVGDKDLLDAVHRINPKVFCCGHIHEGYGVTTRDETTFVNGSVMSDIYKAVNPPIILEI